MTDHRSRLLGHARADLVALPDLVDELSRCLTERPAVSDGGGGKPGSKAPLRLDVLHLVDERTRYPDADPRDRVVIDTGPDLPGGQRVRLQVPIASKIGALGHLSLWVRLIVDMRRDTGLYEPDPGPEDEASIKSECTYLSSVLNWVEGDEQLADDLYRDITSIGKQVRAGLGFNNEGRYACRHCGARAFVDIGKQWMVCETGTPGHDDSIKDLFRQWRHMPALPMGGILTLFPSLNRQLIYTWTNRKKLKPVDHQGRERAWLPWEVLCAVNPGLEHAYEESEKVAV